MDIDAVIDEAIERGNELAACELRAIANKYYTSRRRLILELSTGAELSIWHGMLNIPADADLRDVTILGGGFDLFFPHIDDGSFVPDLCRSAFDMRLAA